MNLNKLHTLGIDIGSTTVKIAILDSENEVLFSDYERHFANIQETLSDLLGRALYKLGSIQVSPVITGSGGLTLAKHLGVPFVQEVIAVSTALQDYAPQTDVAIELGGEDAKIIYFEGGNVEQRMNGVCAGGTGSFIDQMASLLQTDASGLNEYAKNYKALYSIAARCGVFAKSDIHISMMMYFSPVRTTLQLPEEPEYNEMNSDISNLKKRTSPSWLHKSSLSGELLQNRLRGSE